MPFIDIIIFAVIAVLLVLRLRSVLGQRTGYDEQPQRDSRFDANSADVISIDSGRRVDIAEGHGMAALKKADRQFSEKQFLTGAASAFEMILSAYADGDIAKLKRLLGYDLLQSFTQSIQQRASDGESLTITLDELRDAKIVDAKVFDNVASVTVEFQSTQTRMLTDSDDNSIEDEDTGTRDLIDIWTFERDLTLDDPNWKLAETETPDEA
ncbi:MAG: Tim44/TimA family putative adaptor protein [Pseudomonadota bacterium]|nr:Tim44/TimA family putative adaptor protein [Pseudomonadota bacterium]MEC9225568.1 Tim44/TimA family putative adaptor protein [Pseudomonadota bacterium]